MICGWTQKDDTTTTTTAAAAAATTTTTNNNNNNRERIERFLKLKALYNLKKNIQCANTDNYTNQWYTSVQNIRKLTNIFIQNMAKTHAHKIAAMTTLIISDLSQ